MTKTGRTLGEYLDMGAAGIVALCHFVKHLSLDSVTANEITGYQGIREWSEREKTNVLLADIYDNISAFLFAFASSKSKKNKTKKPKPYPRPWVKPKTRHMGSKPIPISQWADWWDKKVREHG